MDYQSTRKRNYMKDKNHCRAPRANQAFTRLELAVVLATLGLLAAIALPVLAGGKTHSEQAMCFSNLRQIGHAFHLWASDHGDRNTWLTPLSEGGTFGTQNILKNRAFFQMGSISNELVTPRNLVCPADRDVTDARMMATDFSNNNPNGGFFRPGFQDRALSYTISLHSFYEVPRSILSSDRNIRGDGMDSACFTGVGSAQAIYVPHPDVDVVWTNSIHIGTGNVLFNDGSVEHLSSFGLQQAVRAANPGNLRNLHYLAPF